MLERKYGLFTDLYELTMAQGYFFSGKEKDTACFDYFFRLAPFGSAYVVFAGLRTLYDQLENFSFTKDDCDYLASVGFKKEFLKFLLNFRFKGTIFSPEEGCLVFPNEPIIRVNGNLIEVQIIETILLNTINFESLIATKSSRIRNAAKEKLVVEFGLRRAQGLGGIQASRAAIIGGADSTSNVFAAKFYGCEATGTQAHSWIQSFDDELNAFRSYADVYPDNCILLVDTYNTLYSGLPNAMIVARELQEKGHRLIGIRLDSGDALSLSKEARKTLDNSGFEYVKIVLSNQLDEHEIEYLTEKKAPIDVFGVGTSLATGKPDGALDGVYKLSMSNEIPKLKLSENPEKISWPGYKKVVRFENEEGFFISDGVLLDAEPENEKPFKTQFPNFKKHHLLTLTMKDGISLLKDKSVLDLRSYAMQQLLKLPDKHKKLKNPTPYLVGYSKSLIELKQNLINNLKSHNQNLIYESITGDRRTK
jgi:nicotinate phosphoribosyltransferase